MKIIVVFSLFACLFSCAQSVQKGSLVSKEINQDSVRIQAALDTPDSLKKYAVAYFGSGCFWCSEAIFQEVKGVKEVHSGYSGGKIEKPSYAQVCTGNSGHAEMLKIYYDSAQVSYRTLLEVFFASHDPTTLNRQGNDSGTQYRSIILYGTELEKIAAKNYIDELIKTKTYSTITTELVPFEKFWMAEDYHQDYEMKNPSNPYIQAVSVPRFEAFKKKRPDLIKE